MTEQERKEEQAIVKNQLNHEDPSQVIEAIRACKEIGNADFVSPLVETFLKWDIQEIKDEVTQLFADLHDTKAMDAYLNKVLAIDLKDDDALLLSSIWQGKYNLNEKLAKMIRKGFGSGFLCAFETFTILENLQGQFEEEHLLEAQVACRECKENADNQQVKDWLDASLQIIINTPHVE